MKTISQARKPSAYTNINFVKDVTTRHRLLAYRALRAMAEPMKLTLARPA